MPSVVCDKHQGPEEFMLFLFFTFTFGCPLRNAPRGLYLLVIIHVIMNKLAHIPFV